MDVRLLWLALGAFAGSVESSLVVSVLPAISAETGVSIAQAGYVVVFYSIAYGIGTPLLTTLFGAVDRRRVVAGAELLFGLAAILFGLLPGFALILVARTMLALGAGLFTSTAQSTAVALAAPGRRGRAVSTVVMGGSIAVAVGAPLGALVAELYGWRVAYVGLGLIAVFASATMWLKLPHDIHGDKRSLRERLALLGIRGVPMTLLSSALGAFAMFVALTYLAPITTQLIGLGQSMMPTVLLAFGIGALGGNFIGGYLVDRIGARSTMVAILGGMIFELAAIDLIALLPAGAVVPVYLVHMAIFGVVTWAYFPSQISRLAVLAPASVPLAASLNLTAMNLGGALSALAGGVALEQLGVASLGWLGAAVAVAAMVVTVLAPDRPDPK